MATLSPFEQKYQSNIAGLAKANNVDVGAAKDMLISNLTQGGQYKGGGVLDFNAAKPDALAHVEQARQAAMQPTVATTQAQPDYQGRINAIHDASQKYKLAQLQASQNKALGQVNMQEQQAMPQYQNLRNQRDVGNVAAVQALREVMANQGLLTSGDNNTEMTNLKIARENQQGDINLQQQQFLNTLQQRRADIMDPSQEQAILGEADLARNQAMLNELYQADQRNFRNSQFDYQKQRDTSNDTFRNDQFAYQKTRDALGDEFRQKQFDEDNRRFGLTYALQQAGVTGFMQDGTPTFAREQFNADNSYRNSQLAIAASKAASSGARSSATAQKKAASDATKAVVAEVGNYDSYEQAANDFYKYFNDMKAAGIDTDAVEKAFQQRFARFERPWIDNPGAADEAFGLQNSGR